MLFVLFLGLAASGINARVTLLSHRSGIFDADQSRKTAGLVALELFGTIAGLTAFALSFVVFDWYWPLVALAVGFWIVGPFVVAGQGFAFFYQTQAMTTLVSIVCSLLICALFFDLI